MLPGSVERREDAGVRFCECASAGANDAINDSRFALRAIRGHFL